MAEFRGGTQEALKLAYHLPLARNEAMKGTCEGESINVISVLS